MNGTRLNLVVIRVANLDAAVRFYAALGVTFTRERHGAGPEHLAADLGGAVFEIYPAAGAADTRRVRIGFRVASLDAVLAAVPAAGGAVLAPARQSPWGRRAVVADPDGHKLELTEGVPGEPGT